MTTSSRIDQSIQPGYPHQHHVLQESLHPHHPFSLATTTSSLNSNGNSSSSMDGVIHGTHSMNSNIPLPPLACLSEAAAAISSAVQQQQQQHHLGRDHPHRYHAGHPMTTTSNITPSTTTTTPSKLTGASLGSGKNYKEEGESGPQLPSPESSSSHHQHQPTQSSSSLATLSTFGSTTLSSALSTAASTTTSSSNHGSSLFDHPYSQGKLPTHASLLIVFTARVNLYHTSTTSSTASGGRERKMARWRRRCETTTLDCGESTFCFFIRVLSATCMGWFGFVTLGFLM